MPAHSHGTRQYFFNIAWSWVSVAALFLSAAAVTPVLIRRLGTARFGIWALATSLVEYVWLIDLGLRPATVKLSAEFRALKQIQELNQLINTALAYSAMAGSAILLVAWLNADRVASMLHVGDPGFVFLFRVVAMSWAAGLPFNIFAATLEGFERFDLSNRIMIGATLLRSGASLTVVLLGHGLREMGIILLVTQALAYSMMYFYCRSIFTEMRLSPQHVNKHMAGRIVQYARQVVSALIASRLVQATVPSIITYFKGAQFVTYFTQSQRILDYAADLISRVGLVSAPRASHWLARGDKSHIVALARYGNRYCATLWGLLASFLFVYGGNFCRLWVNKEFGDQAAVLLPILLVGYTLWMSQFISAAILMGIARYQSYSITLLVEAVFWIAAFVLLLPRYGLSGAALGVSILMSISRFLILNYIFCKEFDLNPAAFLFGIVWRPYSMITVSVGILMFTRNNLFAGSRLIQILLVGSIYGVVYTSLAFYWVVEPEHRALVFNRIAALVARRWDPARAAG